MTAFYFIKYLKYIDTIGLLSDEYNTDKKVSKKGDYNAVDDAHSTLGDLNDKIFENIEIDTNENKEYNIDTNSNIKKKT